MWWRTRGRASSGPRLARPAPFAHCGGTNLLIKAHQEFGPGARIRGLPGIASGYRWGFHFIAFLRINMQKCTNGKHLSRPNCGAERR
ncbi:hypothetical protein CO2235_140034 [Cupriavidus oxalaticus]|uniref:Uncharacterized protein n=1 Tax=Cupriavidus oxalaticus TaxID=96344 RepID=A0A375FV73_9BURK|nr:hypothetical protein CO2235_140034 [Cupriavidus oxalaticus]